MARAPEIVELEAWDAVAVPSAEALGVVKEMELMFSYSGALGGALTGLLVVLWLVVSCWCTLVAGCWLIVASVVLLKLVVCCWLMLVVP